MVKVGILGAAGYTGGELIRLLLNHPEAEIVFANSGSNAGNKITDVHGGLLGETDLEFTDAMPFDEVDVVFFCFGHGKSEAFLKEHTVPAHVKIIDLAQDFRLANDEHDYVYGLPELNALQLQGAQHIANPGCFATCIQLALLPLAAAGLLDGDVMVKVRRTKYNGTYRNVNRGILQEDEKVVLEAAGRLTGDGTRKKYELSLGMEMASIGFEIEFCGEGHARVWGVEVE